MIIILVSLNRILVDLVNVLKQATIVTILKIIVTVVACMCRCSNHFQSFEVRPEDYKLDQLFHSHVSQVICKRLAEFEAIASNTYTHCQLDQ